MISDIYDITLVSDLMPFFVLKATGRSGTYNVERFSNFNLSLSVKLLQFVSEIVLRYL